MSVKSILSIAFAVLCFAPLSANAQIFGHRAMGCGCDSCAAPSCGCEVAPSCGCEVTCDPCAKPKCSLFSGLKAKMAARKACCPAPSCGCEAAPTCCAPAPAPAPTCCAPAPTCCEPAPCCDPCAKPKCSLFSGLKAKMAARKACCPAPSCGCEAAPAAPSCGCN